MGLDAEMAVLFSEPKDEPTLRRLAYELVSAVGPSAFWLDRQRDLHALHPLSKSYWESVPAGAVEVRLSGRYYGPGYERGHWPEYGAILRFLRLRDPGCVIYYGSDSSEPSLFTQEDEDATWAHWAAEQGRPYRA
jgi:hypothetical protein